MLGSWSVRVMDIQLPTENMGFESSLKIAAAEELNEIAQ